MLQPKKKTTNSEIKNSAVFYKEYLNSPKYKERLLKQGYKSPDEVINDRKLQSSKTKINEIPYLGQFTSKNTGSYFIPENNTIDYDAFDLKLYPGSNKEDIITHERSHSAGALKYKKNNNLTLNENETKNINSRNKIKTEHEKNAWEAKADMDVLRYHLKKDNIYDTGTQDFTPELLNKSKNKYKDNTTIKRFLDRFSDKDAVYLMNNIALNNTQNNKQIISAYGGEINTNMNRYAQGGDLTQFNEGGLHSQNPLGGVPIGNNNSVEQGETKRNNFVYSNRIFLDNNIISQYNLPKSLVGKSVADATKFIDNKFKGRNDKISQSTKNGMLSKIAEAQEAMKPQEPEMEQPQEDIEQSQMAYGGSTANRYESGQQLGDTFVNGAAVGADMIMPGSGQILKLGDQLGQTAGQAIGGDKGESIGGLISPMGTIRGLGSALKTGNLNDIPGVGIFGGQTTKQKLALENANNSALNTNNQFSDKYAMGGVIDGDTIVPQKIQTPILKTVPWQRMSQPEKAAKINSLKLEGGIERVKQFKDSISLDSQNRLNANFEKAAALRGMTREQYSRALEKNAKLPDATQSNLSSVGKDGQGCASSEKENAQRRKAESKLAFGGPIDPPTKITKTNLINTPIIQGVNPSTQSDRFRYAVGEQGGVQHGTSGEQGHYLYYDKKPGDAGFNPNVHREFVNQGGYDTYMNSPQGQQYRQSLKMNMSQPIAKFALGGKMNQMADGGYYDKNRPYFMTNPGPIIMGPTVAPTESILQQSRLKSIGTTVPYTIGAQSKVDISNANKQFTPGPSNLDMLKYNAKKVGNTVNDNLGNVARYAPIAANALQLAQLKKPQGERLDRLGNRYKPEYVDEAQLQNIANQTMNNSVNAIGQSGASQGQLRAAILGSQLERTKAISDAYSQAAAQNRQQNAMAQQFNLGVDQTNLGQSTLEKDINARNQGAYDTEKSKLIGKIGENIGSVGTEQAYKKIAVTTTGYNWLGEFQKMNPNATKEETVIAAKKAGVVIDDDKIAKKQALGGYLIKNKVK